MNMLYHIIAIILGCITGFLIVRFLPILIHDIRTNRNIKKRKAFLDAHTNVKERYDLLYEKLRDKANLENMQTSTRNKVYSLRADLLTATNRERDEYSEQIENLKIQLSDIEIKIEDKKCDISDAILSLRSSIYSIVSADKETLSKLDAEATKIFNVLWYNNIIVYMTGSSANDPNFINFLKRNL